MGPCLADQYVQVAIRGEGCCCYVKRKNFCPGVVCCLGRAIAIAILEPVNGDMIPHVTLSGPIFGEP